MEFAGLRVLEVMQTDFAALRVGDRVDLTDPTSPLERARHLPILDDAGRLVGIVSRRALLEASLASASAREPNLRRSFLRSVAPETVMTRQVEAIGADAPLAAAAHRLVLHRIGCLPVVRGDGVMIGLLTEADLLGAAAGLLRKPTPAG